MKPDKAVRKALRSCSGDPQSSDEVCQSVSVYAQKYFKRFRRFHKLIYNRKADMSMLFYNFKQKIVVLHNTLKLI